MSLWGTFLSPCPIHFTKTVTSDLLGNQQELLFKLQDTTEAFITISKVFGSSCVTMRSHTWLYSVDPAQDRSQFPQGDHPRAGVTSRSSLCPYPKYRTWCWSRAPCPRRIFPRAIARGLSPASPEGRIHHVPGVAAGNGCHAPGHSIAWAQFCVPWRDPGSGSDNCYTTRCLWHHSCRWTTRSNGISASPRS